jgi:hypothetical protein
MRGFSKNTYFVLFVLTLAGLSFLHFSPVFSNRYNSDNAIHVLMAYRFEFPADLYYWGQDRLGSLIPMVASVPVKLFGFSPIWCVSIVQYLFLFFGFLLFSTFIKKYFLKVLFAVFWFFPLAIFNYHLQIGQPYSGQLFLLGLSFYLLAKFNPIGSYRLFEKIKLLFSGLCFMLAVWLSDLTAFMLPFYFLFVWSRLVVIERLESRINFSYSAKEVFKGFIATFFGLLAGYLFIKLAKANAGAYVKEYEILFSSIPKIQSGFSSVTDLIGKAFSFKVSNVLISFHAISLGIALLLLILNLIRNKGVIVGQGGLKVFLLSSFVITLLIVISSHWVELNGYDTRYFSFTYFLLFIYIFIAVDSIESKILIRIASIILGVGVFSAATNALIDAHLNYHTPKNLKAGEIEAINSKLGTCALIGDYWSSYNISSINPDKVIATTYDYYATRDFRIIPEVMNSNKILLVGNSWLDSFPPFRNEFGYFLRKHGAPFKIQGLILCEYKRVNSIHIELTNYNYFDAIAAKIKDGIIKRDSLSSISGALVCGPVSNLSRGKYIISCQVGSTNIITTNDSLYIDVSSDQRRKLYYQKTLPMKQGKRLVENLEFDFSIDSLRRNVELSIYLKGKSQVFVKDVNITKK